MNIRGLKILAIFAVFGISGCATNIQNLQTTADHEDKRAAAEQTFTGEPSIVKVPVARNAFIVDEPSAPEMKRLISVSFHNTPMRNAIRSIAREIGVGVIFDTEIKDTETETKNNKTRYSNTTTTQGPDSGKKSKKNSKKKNTNNSDSGSDEEDDYGEFLNRNLTLDFRGRVGDLFTNLSEYTGYYFTLKKGTLIIKEYETFRVAIPNYPELLKEIQANFEGQGAEDISYDELTSNLSYTADYSTNERIKETLVSLRNNMALITMRVLAMNVRLNNEANRGIDWTRLNFGHKNQKQSPFGPFQDSETTTDTTTDPAAAATTALYNSGLAAVGSGTGINLYYEAARFSLSGFLNIIDTYGKSSIIQNVNLQTLSGKPGKLEAISEVPYISQVGVSSLSNNTSSTQATAETATAKSGVTMEILPRWSREEGTLTVSLKIDVLGVTRFLQLSAGNLGVFTQPETTKNSISTTLRLTPYQVGVIGGLIFDKTGGTATGLPGDNYLSKSFNGTKEKEELVVLVKPTVYEFVFTN